MRLILSTSRAEPLVFPRQRRFWGHATPSAQLNGGEQIEPLAVSSAAISSEGRVVQVDEHDDRCYDNCLYPQPRRRAAPMPFVDFGDKTAMSQGEGRVG